MNFLRTLRCDLNKTIVNLGFLGAVLLTTVLCFTANIYTDSSIGRSYSVFEAIYALDWNLISSDYNFASIKVFKSGLSGYISMFLPIIVAFPFMISFCTERNTGLMRFTISRTGTFRYYLSKFIAAFFSGGLSTAAGLLLYGLIVSLIFPGLHTYEVDPTVLAIVMPDSTCITIIKQALSAFLYGSAATLPAFFLSSFCRNPYLVTCVPFLLTYIWNTTVTVFSTAAINALNYDLQAVIYDFYPDSIRLLPFLKEQTASIHRILCFHGSILVISLAGFILIMNLRKDKGV